jgi:fatty-acyl-CoA synthase
LSKYAEKELFAFPALETRHTFSEFDQGVSRVASALKEDYGVKKGDRYAMFLLNSPEFFLSYLALARIGAISVVINARLATAELE